MTIQNNSIMPMNNMETKPRKERNIEVINSYLSDNTEDRKRLFTDCFSEMLKNKQVKVI